MAIAVGFGLMAEWDGWRLKTVSVWATCRFRDASANFGAVAAVFQP
jgi:hypothetical protein